MPAGIKQGSQGGERREKHSAVIVCESCLELQKLMKLLCVSMCVKHRVSLDFPESKKLNKAYSTSSWLLLLLHLRAKIVSSAGSILLLLLSCSLDILMSFPSLDWGQYTWAEGFFWNQSHDGWLLARGLMWLLRRLNPVSTLRNWSSDGEGELNNMIHF